MPWRVRPARCEGQGLVEVRGFRVFRDYRKARNWKRKHGIKKQERGTRAFWIFTGFFPLSLMWELNQGL